MLFMPARNDEFRRSIPEPVPLYPNLLQTSSQSATVLNPPSQISAVSRKTSGQLKRLARPMSGVVAPPRDSYIRSDWTTFFSAEMWGTSGSHFRKDEHTEFHIFWSLSQRRDLTHNSTTFRDFGQIISTRTEL